jgi:hypothetical protein
LKRNQKTQSSKKKRNKIPYPLRQQDEQQEFRFPESKMHTKWSLEMGIFPSPLNFLEACFSRTNTPKEKTKQNRKKNQNFWLNEKFLFIYMSNRERERE